MQLNYYPRHLGDYARDTGHLTMLEHGAYTKLLDRYYATEEGIPQADAYKLTGARSHNEKKAVDGILEEFFSLVGGVWIQGRVQEEIERYQDKQNKAKQSADARWNKTKPQSDGNATASPDAMRSHCDGNANQEPRTNNQEEERVVVTHDAAPSPSTGEVCKTLVKLGIGGVNPGHPKLLMLLQAGAELDEFAGAAQEAVTKQKPSFAYVLAMMKGRREEAKIASVSLAKGSLKKNGKPWYLTGAGIEAKVKEIGFDTRGEVMVEYKFRLFEACGITKEMVRQANADFK